MNSINNSFINSINDENDDVLLTLDVFDQIEHTSCNESITYTPPISPVEQNSIIINIDNREIEIDLILLNYDNTIYKQPPNTSIDAYNIWKAANIPEMSNVRQIETRLIKWALENSTLEIIINNKSIKSIDWKSSKNYSCKSSWRAFLLWILCASSSNTSL